MKNIILATSATYIDTGRTFSPSSFRSSFKDGIAKPSLFHFKIIRYPNIFFKSTGTNQTLSGLMGLNNFLPTQATNYINTLTSIPTQATSILNIGETIYQNLNNRGLSDLVFRCNKVLLPEKNIETYTTKTYGPSTEFPREIENSRFVASFLCSGTYVEHDIFQTWLDKSFDYDRKSSMPSYNVAYYDDIVSDAQIISYNENGDAAYLQTIEDIYPVSVGEINYDWNEKNEIIEFAVTFAYRILKTEKIAKSISIKSQGLSKISTAINTLSNIF